MSTDDRLDLDDLGSTESRPRPKKSRKLLWGFLTFALVLLLAVGGAAAFYLGNLWKAADKVERKAMLPNTTDANRPPEANTKDGSLNFILMGSDTRESGTAGRSDVLMVAHVNAKRDKAYLISFPRDMWVPIPGHNEAKINAAYALGGPQLTTQTVEGLLDVRMDHAAEIDFEGFIGLTEALGGVTVNNKIASHESHGDYTWPKGKITIQGKEALAYVRQRKELPNGDLDRAERQRTVVKAIVAELMSRDLVTNPAKFQRVVNDLGSFVTVDDSLDNSAMFSLARSMKLDGGSDIQMLQAPMEGFGTSPDGQSIDVVDEAQLKQLAQAIKDDDVESYYQEHKGEPLTGR